MAVYEHTYKPWVGDLTPAWSRFLIIPRYAYRTVFASKLFIAFFAICFICPLVFAILIYLRHNPAALGVFKLAATEILIIDASFFELFVRIQGSFAFFMTLLIGPPLIARDMTNNALPLYLCRPFSRTEYVVGKISVLVILLSMITWVPGTFLFLFQSYLDGGGWFRSHLYVLGAIYFGSWIWILLLAILSMTISAWVKWRVVASAALLAIYFIPAIVGGIFNQLFITRWGNVISLSAMMDAVWSGLFGTFVRQSQMFGGVERGRLIMIPVLEPPLWFSWLLIVGFCGLCLLLLSRKVRAYEVIK